MSERQVKRVREQNDRRQTDGHYLFKDIKAPMQGRKKGAKQQGERGGGWGGRV